MHILNNRFNYLRGMEALAAFLLPLMFSWHWNKAPDDVDWPLGYAALFAVSFLLVQGALYWHLKQRALTGDAALPPWFGTVFGAFKVVNLLVFGALGVAFGLKIGRAGWNMTLAWPAGIFGFAVLEHINYYYYQLMYDTSNAVRYVLRNRRLRKAALGIDLQRTRRA
ncbi:MAG TPA: hypothetical protein VGC21_17295 [Telluria sp.]|jgi:hypothetical protein